MAGVALCLVALTAQAATIVVDSVSDENADTPPNANCTLREAVLSANGNVAVDACAAGEAVPVVDVIAIPAWTFLLTIAESGDASGGSLDLTEDAEVVGAGRDGTVINGQRWNGSGVFHVRAGAVVEVTGLTVANGRGILGVGGGIYNEGEATIRGCRVIGNLMGAVFNRDIGIMTIEGCHITQNEGGGVNNVGDLTVVDSSIADNDGIGISSTGTLHVNRTTVSGNSRLGIAGYGGMEILNSTISGNDPGAGGVGGGISINIDGVILINNSTITANSAGWGSGLFVQPNAIAQLQNTIIGGNLLSADCDVYGTLISTGGNIESPGNSCGFDSTTDLVNVTAENLALGPLLHHGGATWTHGLLPGSVAIDGGVSSGPIMGCPGEDQRAQPRGDGLCDVGAVEVQAGEDLTELFADGFESGDTSGWGDVVGG